jgi:hypothetical protein
MADHETPDVELRESFTDDELAALALAADADAPVDDDAVAIWDLLGSDPAGALPSWYMPAPMGACRPSGWRGLVVRCGAVSVIASFVAINAYGLCNTYGQLHF